MIVVVLQQLEPKAGKTRGKKIGLEGGESTARKVVVH